MSLGFLHWVASHPSVYDLVQKLSGRERNLGRLKAFLSDEGGQVVLDVGAGTGACARILPPGATYLWLDNDRQKLRGFRAKMPGALAVLGDATCIALKNKSVDVVLCVGVSHHLADAELDDLFQEAARVCRKKLVFLDPVEKLDSRVSNLLWKYDRGSHPRRKDAICSIMEKWFYIQHREEYAVYHHYVLAVGRPKVGPLISEREKEGAR